MIDDKIKVAAYLIQQVYLTEDGGVGGYGHIVFDDENLDNNSIRFCINEAETGAAAGNLSGECRIASLSALYFFISLNDEERISAIQFLKSVIRGDLFYYGY